MKKGINYKKQWTGMKKQIEEQEKHAEDYWWFGCLKNSCDLIWDIGTEVYFAMNGQVCKGTVKSVNPAGMCWVEPIPYRGDNSAICISHKELYTNVRFALMKIEGEKVDESPKLNMED